MVNPFFYPYEGGIERRMRAVGKRLSDDHDIDVVTSRLAGTKSFDIVDGMKVHRLPSKYLHIYNPPVIFTRGIKKKIGGLKPDLIHFHYRWSPEYTITVASFLDDTSVVFTWHNSYGEGVGWQRPLSLLNDEIFKLYLAKKCDKVICVSEHLRLQLSSHGIQDKILKVIHNGIESKDPPYEEDNFILYIGRLVQTKGLDVLADAMRGVKSKLIVCGKGPYSKVLERAENIELRGFVSEEEKNHLLKKCKFLVLPSKREAFGIVLLEAMANGKPVVASRVGGIPEVVGDAGILAPPNDSEKLKIAINSLLSDKKLRLELGKKSLKRVSLFSWDKIASQVEDVYKEAVS